MKLLYMSQIRALNDILARGGRPLVHSLVAGTGCGKTGISITASVALDASRILVVCPAIVRRHWAAEFAAWAGRIDVGIVEMGRTRTSGTKKALLARDWAYIQNVNIVSYDLLPHVTQTGWDMVIVDESHNLGDALSKQSKTMGEIRAANPSAHWLLLSATPIPTNAQQVWYPQYLLHGADKYGKPAPNGGLSWKFARAFFDIIRSDYGTSVGRLREDRREDLRRYLHDNCTFLSRQEISGDLPALDVKPLYVAKADLPLYEDWINNLPEDVTHAVILVYHLQTAQEIFALVRDRGAFYIDGQTATSDRHTILEAAASSERAILVATMGSLSEGVRLMWPQKVLIAEWRRSPGQMTQLLGRFQSVADPRKPQLEIAIDDSADMYAELLLQRVADINSVLGQSSIPAVIDAVFAPRELDEERIGRMFDKMLASAPAESVDSWDTDDEEW